MRPTPRSLSLLLAVVTIHIGLDAQQPIRVRSGPGQQSRYLLGPPDGPFAQPLTAADFQAARTGPFAIDHDRLWRLATDPVARSVTTWPMDHTALYAASFFVQVQPMFAFLTLEYTVDNQVGAPAHQGVFLNGTAISGNTTNLDGINGPYVLTRSDVAPLLVAGTNWLYIYAFDAGGPAALAFSAEFRFDPPPYHVPFGQPCQTTGAPVLTPNQLPRVGQPFAYTLANLPSNEVVVGVFGAGAASWGSVPLPVALGFVAMPECQLYVAPELTLPPQGTGTTGQILAGFLIPADPLLIGAEFFHQSVVSALASVPSRLFVTNAAHGIVGQ